ncbi:hypothetical protein Tco_0729598 [Tanacetum coccineum]|uniref:Retroviral polymerase SH3-like domain-containing protein n=1 Tax=Tanacetum coccineum TaxID=301880 RepID=A0ABQ4YS34_9ASTR
MFGCHVHIHNHKDHRGKFDAKADDGFFLGYFLVAKAFRVFNIMRQEMEEFYHVTFSEDDQAISKTTTEGDDINFNENMSFPNDEFRVPRSNVHQCSGKGEYFPYVPAYDPLFPNNINIPNPITPSKLITPSEPITSSDPVSPSEEIPLITTADDHPVGNEQDNSESVEDLGDADDQVSPIRLKINEDETSPTTDSPAAEVFKHPPVPQDRWSREKHIDLVNILGEPQAGVTTRSRIRDSKAASAHECLYVNFLSEIEPKKLAKALEEEGWIISMQEELNQFE